MSTSEACEILGIHPNTLRKRARDGKIKTIRTSSSNSPRRYDVESYLAELRDGEPADKVRVAYCRVSSAKQKDDLERQCDYMRSIYQDIEIVRDVGSGLNFKRKGLKAVLERAMQGERISLVVAHRDRLCRFGFDLIVQIIERSGGEVVVLDKSVCSPEQELTADLLAILHVFSARLHGLRSYKNKIKQSLSDERAENSI